MCNESIISASSNVPALPNTIGHSRGFTPINTNNQDISLVEPPVISSSLNPQLNFPRSLRPGCYLISYRPSGIKFTVYDGTIRIESHSAGLTISGDLYRRPLVFAPGFTSVDQSPNPANGIPIFARSNYQYYIRVVQLSAVFSTNSDLILEYELYRFNKLTQSWSQEGFFSTAMNWINAPTGYPSANDYLEGEVKNAIGNVVGRMRMGWVSKYLRKASIEIDRVASAEPPLHNGTGLDWRNIFDQVDWDLTVINSDDNIIEPNGEEWTDAEIHAEMLRHRDLISLDEEWRYHLMAVRRLASTERGIMYDHEATDSNKVPREGAAIASHWMIPTNNQWGTTAGMRFGLANAAYFRTALHEIGHVMGQEHNTADNCLMNTTDIIAGRSTLTNSFPGNIVWSFSAREQRRLRHYPDIYVRPGGATFGAASEFSPHTSSADAEAFELEDVKLKVEPVLEVVPVGAPVRLNLCMSNLAAQNILVPQNISLKKGFVEGYVESPCGLMRTFKPLVVCLDEELMDYMKPDEKPIEDSITLLRGRQGALFQEAGLHKVVVQVRWHIHGALVMVKGETYVMITPAVDEGHAKAALRIFTTPDTLLTLALGGDHLTEGVEAIKEALENPVLKPHYSYIEAKRLGVSFEERKANYKAMAHHIKEETVMSPAEISKAKQLIEPGKKIDKKSYEQVMKVLIKKDNQPATE